ncbi:hypothetical protein [Nannocystis bainbridge]|uniref:Uncharacterized protein n=1 Tax=Nannocystis bainbridge TaxID=2995303 RepID=A0ABT5DRC8_9BACT|nr:hypothetical protein [Nannocystis bainbridge]MDC0716200.1 hypothetical protein [Nannocystis bainbridge]
MRNTTLITSALFLALFAVPGCKEDPAPNEPGEFGEPCVIGEADNTPDGCASGLSCYFGYCEELCATSDDCQPIESREHTCAVGVCHIACDSENPCPETLATPLVCATNMLCEGEEYN